MKRGRPRRQVRLGGGPPGVRPSATRIAATRIQRAPSEISTLQTQAELRVRSRQAQGSTSSTLCSTAQMTSCLCRSTADLTAWASAGMSAAVGCRRAHARQARHPARIPRSVAADHEQVEQAPALDRWVRGPWSLPRWRGRLAAHHASEPRNRGPDPRHHAIVTKTKLCR